MSSTPARAIARPANGGLAAFAICTDAAPLPLKGSPHLSEHLRGDAAQALILYEDPVAYLARHMQKGSDPQRALSRWKTRAREYLDVLMRTRKRPMLCQIPPNRESATDLAEALGAAGSGLVLPHVAPENTVTDVFFHALAALEVVQHPDAVDLMGQFHARSIGPYSDLPSLTEIAVLLRHSRVARDADATQVAEGVNAQVIALQQALCDMQIDYKARVVVLERALGSAQEERVAQVETLEQSLAKAHAEHKAQVGALEQALSAAQVDRQAEAELKLQVSTLEQALREMQTASTSRTAGQDMQGKTFNRLSRTLEEAQRDLKSDRKLVSLLNDQIGQLNQELIKAQASGSADEITNLMAEREINSQTKSALRQLTRQLEEALRMVEKNRTAAGRESAARIEELRAEIEALHNSTSWRFTQPMRSVTQIFRK